MQAPSNNRLTLVEVAEHFQAWRAKKNKGERIPAHLWSEALALLSAYRISQITRALRLSGTDLRKRQVALSSAKDQPVGDANASFVEIERAVVKQVARPNPMPGLMEIERPDGLRLRIQPATGADMVALVDHFMGV